MIRIAKNEKGIALVVSLIMLVLLTILGTYALSTSSTELIIAGNYRNNECAFYLAEAGIGYGQEVYKTKVLPGTDQSCWPYVAGTKCSDPDGKQFLPVPLPATPGQRAEINITWVRTGDAPKDYDSTDNETDYYVITSRGFCNNNATAEAESMVMFVRAKAGST